MVSSAFGVMEIRDAQCRRGLALIIEKVCVVWKQGGGNVVCIYTCYNTVYYGIAVRSWLIAAFWLCFRHVIWTRFILRCGLVNDG